MVITVPDGVILQHELARERGISIQRYRGRVSELFVTEGQLITDQERRVQTSTGKVK